MNKPIIYMMVGLPGSGKSTYAKEMLTHVKADIVSSDEIRATLYGDESIQGNSNAVFSVVYDNIRANMKRNVDTILDATNIKKKDRRGIFREFKNADIIAIYMNTPFDECVKRNNERERKVPAEVIENMQKKFDIPTYAEGFNNIIVVNSYRYAPCKKCGKIPPTYFDCEKGEWVAKCILCGNEVRSLMKESLAMMWNIEQK